uniref:tRNA-synt_2 domain-containing protein n=1 Tax=Gongylonema pulchrum TaxID=637853 RepID=A0A183DZN4_9BILA
LNVERLFTRDDVQTTAEAPSGEALNVERLFTRDDVQSLLRRLTGMNLQEKLFRERRLSRPQRSHFALMTDEAFQKTVKSMRNIGEHFLQFVPVLEPRCSSTTVKSMRNIGEHFLQFVPVLEPRCSSTVILAKDPELDCFDESKFVFTDLSFGLGVRIRSVVVRETDGTLRSASPEERDRMGRVYRGHPHRPVNEPQLFKQPYLQVC